VASGCSRNDHEISERRELLLTDPRHVEQVFGAAEGAVLGAVRDDLLRQDRTDTRERFE